jgi:hypothetical protein
MNVLRHCSEAEARQIDAQRLAQEVIGGDPLVPFDLAGVAAEVVSLRQQLEGAVEESTKAHAALGVALSLMTPEQRERWDAALVKLADTDPVWGEP